MSDNDIPIGIKARLKSCTTIAEMRAVLLDMGYCFDVANEMAISEYNTRQREEGK